MEERVCEMCAIQFDEIIDIKTDKSDASYLVEEPDSPPEGNKEPGRSGGLDHAQRVVEISETKPSGEDWV